MNGASDATLQLSNKAGIEQTVSVDIDDAEGQIKKSYISKVSDLQKKQLTLAVTDAYKRLVKPSIETEFRLLTKKKADEEAIKVFSENLIGHHYKEDIKFIQKYVLHVIQ